MSDSNLLHRNKYPRAKATAPQAAAVTVAALLGVNPAIASSARPINLRTNAASTSHDNDWRVPREQGVTAIAPKLLDEVESGAGDLTSALRFAELVAKALPVNHDADAEADRALAQLAAKRTKRKLSKK